MAEDNGSFIFYQSFLEAAEAIENKNERLVFLEAVIKFGIKGIEPNLKGMTKGMFSLVRPNISANKNKYSSKSESGFIGNLKKWHIDLHALYVDNLMTKEEVESEITHRKNIAKNNLRHHKASQNIANDNVNDNVNDNLNDNDLFEVKTENFLSIDEYMNYRELEFNKLNDEIIIALNQKVGITRPYCWCNRRNPQGYFDLVDCLIRVRDDVEWRSSVQRNNNISKEKLLLMLYDFVKEIKDSKVYLGYDGYDGSDGKENFIAHFTRWLKLKLVK